MATAFTCTAIITMSLTRLFTQSTEFGFCLLNLEFLLLQTNIDAFIDSTNSVLGQSVKDNKDKLITF